MIGLAICMHQNKLIIILWCHVACAPPEKLQQYDRKKGAQATLRTLFIVIIMHVIHKRWVL